MPEHQGDPAFDGHLDEAPHRRAEPLRRSAAATARRSPPSACQDQVGRQLAPADGAPTLIPEASRIRAPPLRRRRSSSSAARRGLGRVLERFAPGHLGLERLERHAEAARPCGTRGRCSYTSAESARPRPRGSPGRARCSTVARSSNVAPGSTRDSFTSSASAARLVGREIAARPAGRRSSATSAVAKFTR